MFRFCVVCCMWMLGFLDAAMAETAAGRGDYLVNKSPMACAFYAGLKQADLADIIAYLHTVPPLQ
jgi:hypothetical protein